MLYHLSYVVKSIRVGDISELFFDINVFEDIILFVCVGVMYSGEYDVCYPTELDSVTKYRSSAGRALD